MKNEKEKKAPSYDEALKRAADLCSKSEKTRQDIKKKLHAWNVHEKHHKKILQELEEGEFIDENRYAESYIREKFHLNGWGRNKLRYGLRQKNLSSAIVSEAIQTIDEEEYLSKLRDILQKKSQQLKEKDHRKRKAKLIRHAASKGFEEQIVNEMIDELLLDELHPQKHK